LALIALDGVARRLAVYPPDLAPEHVPSLLAAATVNALVSDRPTPDAGVQSLIALLRAAQGPQGKTEDDNARPIAVAMRGPEFTTI
jgi:hypothetical protein